MSDADFPGAADAAPAVGAFVRGNYYATRTIVRAASLYQRYHTLADDIDPDVEAYLTPFDYPAAEYCAHYNRAGNSPKGYTGPASCRRLVFDIDRAGNLAAALGDVRQLLHFLLQRYTAKLEDGIAAYYSGSKGFHLTVELLPAFAPSPAVPMICKRLAVALADAAGVQIDPSVYDHQRLFRLPNSRHAKTGLYKRHLTHAELFALDLEQIRELAKHPAGYDVPSAGEHVQELEDDYLEAAEAAVADRSRRALAPSASSHPVVPKFVRDFIAWQTIDGESRHVTLFRCAAVLAEAGTPDAVIAGLLEEPAVKTGLELADVRRQIRCGIDHAKAKGGSA